MLTNQLSTRELLGSRRFYRRNSQGDRPQYGSNSQPQSSQAGSSEGMYSQMLGSQFDSQNSDVLFPQQQDSEGSVNYYQKYKAQSALFSANQAARQPVSVVRGCPQMTLQEQMEANRKKAKERDDREILNLFVSMLKDCVEEVKTLTTGIQDKIDKTATTQGEKAEQLLQKVTDELGKHAGRLQDAVKRREEDKAKLSDLESVLAAKDAEISQLKHQLKKALAAKEDNIISTLTSTLTEQQELTREQLLKLKEKENDNTEVLKESIKSCEEISRQLKQLEEKTKERAEADKKNERYNCCKDKGEESNGNYAEKNLSRSKQEDVTDLKLQQKQWHMKQQDIHVVDPQLQNLHPKNDQISVNWSRQADYFHGLQPNMAFSSTSTDNQLSCEPATSLNISYPSYQPIAPSTAPIVVNPTTVQVQPQLPAASSFPSSSRPSMVGVSSTERSNQSESAGMYGLGRSSGLMQNPYQSWLQENKVEIEARKPHDRNNLPQQNSIPSTKFASGGTESTNQHQGQAAWLQDSTNQHQGQAAWLQDSTNQHQGQRNRDGWNSHEHRQLIGNTWMTNQHQRQRKSDVAGLDNEYGLFDKPNNHPNHQAQRRTMIKYNQQLGQLPPFSTTSSFQSINKAVGTLPDCKGSVKSIEVHQIPAEDAQYSFSPGIKSGVKKHSPIATVLPQVRTRSMIQQAQGETKIQETVGKDQEMTDREETGEPQVTVTKRGRKGRKKQKSANMNEIYKSEDASQMESQAIDISCLLGTKMGPSSSASTGRKRAKSEASSREQCKKGNMKSKTASFLPRRDDVVKYPSTSPCSPDCPPVPSQSCEDLPARKLSARCRKRSHSCTDLSGGLGEVMKTMRNRPASVVRRTKIVGNKTPASAKGKNISTYDEKAVAQSSTGLPYMEVRKAKQIWRPASHADLPKTVDEIASASVYDFNDQEDVPERKPTIKSVNKPSKLQKLLETARIRPKSVNTPGGTEDAHGEKRDFVKQYVSPYSDVEEPESDDPYEEDDGEIETTHCLDQQGPNISKEMLPEKYTFGDSQILRYQDSDEKFSNTYNDREDMVSEKDVAPVSSLQNKKEDNFSTVVRLSNRNFPGSKIPQSPESEEEPGETEAESMTQESVDPMSLDIFSQERKMQSDSPSLKKTLAIAQKWAVGESARKKEDDSHVVSNRHSPDSDSSSSPSLWIMEDFFRPPTRDVKPRVSCTTTQGTKRKGQLTMNINDVDPGDSKEDSQSQEYFSLKIPNSPVRPRHDQCNEQVVPDQSPATPQSIRQPPSPKVSRGSGLKRRLCDSSASWFVDASRECLKQLRSGSHKTAQK